MEKNYQSKQHKSNQKFEVMGDRELMVQVPLPMAEVARSCKRRWKN